MAISNADLQKEIAALNVSLTLATQQLLTSETKGSALTSQVTTLTQQLLAASAPSADSTKIINLFDQVNKRNEETNKQQSVLLAAYTLELKAKDKAVTALMNSVEEKTEAVAVCCKIIADGIDGVNNAMSELEAEKESLEKAQEKLKKWTSSHNLKVAGIVVGSLILIAGIIYVVRRLAASGESTLEVNADQTANPDLAIAANY